MRRRNTLVAVAASVAVAFTALPAIASADFETTPALSGADFPLAFTLHGGESHLYAEATVDCESQSGEGKFTNDMTGTTTVAFEGCHTEVLGTTVKCTSPGQAKGTIQTNKLTTHLVYLEPTHENNRHETPGIVLTPNGEAGIFATFVCAGLVSIEVAGNGLAGTIASPGLGEEFDEAKVEVNASEEGQEHTTVVTSEGNYTQFGLEASLNGGEPAPAYADLGSDTVTLDQTVTTTTE